jgi:ribosomal protein S3AE
MHGAPEDISRSVIAVSSVVNWTLSELTGLSPAALVKVIVNLYDVAGDKCSTVNEFWVVDVES